MHVYSMCVREYISVDVTSQARNSGCAVYSHSNVQMYVIRWFAAYSFASPCALRHGDFTCMQMRILHSTSITAQKNARERRLFVNPGHSIA